MFLPKFQNKENSLRVIAAFLVLSFALPSSALALRSEGVDDPKGPVRTGLEETLLEGTPDAALQAISTRITNAVGLTSSAVSPLLSSRSHAAGLEELQAELARIDALTEINGVSIEEIEMRARPGQYSDIGFLSPDERFKDVLKADLITLHRLGTSAGGMAAHLREIIRQVEKVGTLSSFQSVEIGYGGQKLRVTYYGSKGKQRPLFDNKNKPTEGNPDNAPWTEKYAIRNLSNGLEVRISGDEASGVIGYIERYGFFEGGGQRNLYRVDPEVLYAIIHGLPATAQLKQRDAETKDKLRSREVKETNKRELEKIVEAERAAEVSKEAQVFFRAMAEHLSIPQIKLLLLLAESRRSDYTYKLLTYYEGKDFRVAQSSYGSTLRRMDVVTPDGEQSLNLVQQINVLQSVLAQKEDKSAGLEERLPGWLKGLATPEELQDWVYGVQVARLGQQPIAILFQEGLIPGDKWDQQVLLVGLEEQMRAALSWPDSVPFRLGLLDERVGLEEAGFSVTQVLRHPEAGAGPLAEAALPLVVAEAVSAGPRLYVDPIVYAGLEELTRPSQALFDLADLFA